MQRMKTILSVGIIAIVGAFAVLAGCSLAGCSSSSGAGSSSGTNMSSGASTPSASHSSAKYRQVSQEEALSMMQTESDYVIVDVRRQDEYASGHIPGAICIPNESIGTVQPAELPDLNQLIMVYCRSGNRSKQAAEKLADMGYSNIVEFGGINTWPGEVVTD